MKTYPRAGNLYMFQGRRYLGGVPYVEKNWKRGRSNLRWHYGGRTFWGWRRVLALEDAMTSTQVEIQKVFLRPLMTTKKRIKLREIVQVKTRSFQTLKFKKRKNQQVQEDISSSKTANNQVNRVYFKDYINNCAENLSETIFGN